MQNEQKNHWNPARNYTDEEFRTMDKCETKQKCNRSCDGILCDTGIQDMEEGLDYYTVCVCNKCGLVTSILHG